MTLSTNDFALARAARWLSGFGKTELATQLLSCELDFQEDGSECNVSLTCPRTLYELLWDVDGFATVNGILKLYERGEWLTEDEASDDAWLLHEALQETLIRGEKPDINMTPTYGAANRDAKTQTELYMYAFGDDPIGQQIQVIDTGPAFAKNRQLLVSPAPVLPVEDVRMDASLCFVIMPFAPEFRAVYDQGIQPAVEAAKLECRRGDDIMQAGQILAQVWTSLLRARLVVADVSRSNGNVLYELGMAHVLGHQVILLTQNINDVPFDLRQQRHIVYSTDSAGLATLRASLRAAIESTLAAL